MKLFAKTTGPFMLYVSGTNEVVEGDRPYVIGASHFITSRAAKGELTVLANDLPDSADDAVFAKFWAESKGDAELAMASYRSTLEPAAEVAPEPPAPPAKKGK